MRFVIPQKIFGPFRAGPCAGDPAANFTRALLAYHNIFARHVETRPEHRPTKFKFQLKAEERLQPATRNKYSALVFVGEYLD